MAKSRKRSRRRSRRRRGGMNTDNAEFKAKMDELPRRQQNYYGCKQSNG